MNRVCSVLTVVAPAAGCDLSTLTCPVRDSGGKKYRDGVRHGTRLRGLASRYPHLTPLPRESGVASLQWFLYLVHEFLSVCLCLLMC